MRVEVLYFEGNQYIGSLRAERSWLSADEIATSRYWPNTAYWCQDCGEIWARSITQAPIPLPQAWGLVHLRCPQHGAGWLVSWTDLDKADEALTRREFLVTIEGVSNECSSKYFPAGS